MSPVWTNTPLVVALAATVVAQVVKVLLVALTERRWVFERLLETGGMPSSHSSMVVALVHFLPQLLVLIVGALLFGWLPSVTAAIAFVLGIVILVVFTMGLGMLTAALNAAFRDVENFVDLIVMVATWLSPVLYRISMVEQAIGGTIWWWLYQLNPLTIVVELFHVAFWRYGPEVVEAVPSDPSLTMPGEPYGLWWAGLLIAGATFAVGTIVFERSKRRFAQEL